MHFVERSPHFPRRIDVLQLDLIKPHAKLVTRSQLLHSRQRGHLDILPANRDHFVHGPVTDDFAHGGFGQIAQGLVRIADVEEVLLWIGDPVLNDPFDKRRVQVAGDHRFLFNLIARRLVGIRVPRSVKTEFQL